jgi:hypothetical protein
MTTTTATATRPDLIGRRDGLSRRAPLDEWLELLAGAEVDAADLVAPIRFSPQDSGHEAYAERPRAPPQKKPNVVWRDFAPNFALKITTVVAESLHQSTRFRPGARRVPGSPSPSRPADPHSREGDSP